MAGRRWWAGSIALTAAFVVLASGACGGDDGPLDDAEDAMAELRSGRMALQLSATAGGSGEAAGPVGFRMEGPFSFEGGGDLPVLDLRYTVLLGGDEKVTRVVSTGDAVFVVLGDDVTEVAEEDVASLRLGTGEGGVADLGIAGWVRDPKVEKREDGTRVVSGRADVGDLLSDLARIGQQAGASGEGLDDDASERLDRLVRSSQVTVEMAPDDLPRTVRAVVDFGADVPAEVVDALGPYAAAHLELTVSLERLKDRLKVDKPSA